MRRLTAILFLALPALRGAEVIDRIAVTVDKEIVTLSEIMREIRLQAFQESGAIDTTPAARRAAAGRLVDRTLIAVEAALNRFPNADLIDAAPELEQLKKRYPNPAGFEAGLRKYQITEDDLAERIQSQLTIFRFIDFRFQTSDQPSRADLEKYYREKFVPLAKQSGVQTVPPFEEVQTKIEEILTKEQANRAMEKWLVETRNRAAIQYHDGAFQ